MMDAWEGSFVVGAVRHWLESSVTQMAYRMTSLLPIEYYYYKVIVFYAS